MDSTGLTILQRFISRMTGALFPLLLLIVVCGCTSPRIHHISQGAPLPRSSFVPASATSVGIDPAALVSGGGGEA